MRLSMFAVIGGLAACAPAPRSQSYFEAHPEAAKQTAAQCAKIRHSRQDCENAQLAVAKIKQDERLQTLRRTF